MTSRFARTTISLACGLVLQEADAALAQDASTYPARPVTIIIPNAIGGSSEILARILQPKLTAYLDQPVLIVAQPGGSGIIGMDATAKAAPNGLTMVLGNTQQFVRMYLEPDVPTAVEAGYPGYVSSLWFGIALPAATPRPIADKLHAAFASVLCDEEVKKQFLNRAVIVRTSTPAEFEKFISSELVRWRKVAETMEVKK